MSDEAKPYRTKGHIYYNTEGVFKIIIEGIEVDFDIREYIDIDGADIEQAKDYDWKYDKERNQWYIPDNFSSKLPKLCEKPDKLQDNLPF